MKKITLKIKNSTGVMLNAVLDLPINGKPKSYALFAHCFTCSSNLNAVRHISQALTEKGFGVLRFDFTGLGQSEGEFADSHFLANVSDLEDVYSYLEVNYKAPDLLVGHSLGGAAVIVAASKLSNIRAIATIGAPSSVAHTTKHFSHQIDEIKTKGEVSVSIGGRPFLINKNFVEQFSKTNLPAVLRSLKKPLLILHATFDKIVDIENAQELYSHAFHPKSFVSLDNADHLLTEKSDSKYAGNVIAAWAERYIDSDVTLRLDTKGEQVVGHLNLEDDNFTTTIQTNTHTYLADEPTSAGGDNLGASPYEFLNAGLAACTAMTLKMYAEHKKWDLKEVYVYLSHSKEHKIDMGKKVSLDKIDKKLRLIGDLSEEQKLKLKEIAAKCPVHRTLTSIVEISTTVED